MINENFKNIKKGTQLKINNGLGLCTAYALESIRQGKGYKTVLCLQDDSQWKLGDLRKELVRFNNYDKK